MHRSRQKDQQQRRYADCCPWYDFLTEHLRTPFQQKTNRIRMRFDSLAPPSESLAVDRITNKSCFQSPFRLYKFRFAVNVVSGDLVINGSSRFEKCFKADAEVETVFEAVP